MKELILAASLVALVFVGTYYYNQHEYNHPKLCTPDVCPTPHNLSAK